MLVVEYKDKKRTQFQTLVPNQSKRSDEALTTPFLSVHVLV